MIKIISTNTRRNLYIYNILMWSLPFDVLASPWSDATDKFNTNSGSNSLICLLSKLGLGVDCIKDASLSICSKFLQNQHKSSEGMNLPLELCYLNNTNSPRMTITNKQVGISTLLNLLYVIIYLCYSKTSIKQQGRDQGWGIME